MPRIFDNIEQKLLPELRGILPSAERADFCVGYFNLRGWQKLDDIVEQWAGGEGACCRLLVGMQTLPKDEVHASRTLGTGAKGIDNQAANRLKRSIADEFREQLIKGAPSNSDEAALKQLSTQLKAEKVIVKLFLRHTLHAKLYLIHRPVYGSPIMGYLGSSNLTLSGLAKQGELNVDVQDQDACNKLQKWFDDRWSDNRCIDISKELAEVIDESWVQERAPYHIYLKIAYHLAQEARAGISEFSIPHEFENRLFEFQKRAVQIAARHVNKRGGVLVGDVVGLGKTLVGTALARIFEDDHGISTLIICPKNLMKMWQSYVDEYGMRAKVVPFSKVIQELPDIPARFRLVLIDESHNLRNREGKQYRAIQEYITQSDSKCILMSATPYNKTYLDLASQLRLFIPEDKDLGIRPEKLINDLGGGAMGETEFQIKYQCTVRSLPAFEKSPHADDWRDLIKLYMVRRTRSFIKANYAKTDSLQPSFQRGQEQRKYLEFPDGGRSYFPDRLPKTVKFALGSSEDPYAQLYSDRVVQAINDLNLPRYGLAKYIAPIHSQSPTDAEQRHLSGLSRGGRRLMGFSRTNLFKRLESGGPAFIQSLDRHILRNYIFLHAIENGSNIPIGTQDAELLDTRNSDEDSDSMATLFELEIQEEDAADPEILLQASGYRRRAAVVYQEYATRYQRRFKWLRPTLFAASLKEDLLADAQALIGVLNECGDWDANRDRKLTALVELLQKDHPNEKVLIFTQFADTVRYLAEQLQIRGVDKLAGVTGRSSDPTGMTWRFSPVSGGKRDRISPADELRVLVATDVLSEGHNLQDCAIIVNYDLPWAIIRLIQRTGRVDRIGQNAPEIRCYSFLPADGVEQIINLRSRLRRRLRENAEVVGTDEAFFEDEENDRVILDLYHEKSGILDDDEDTEVDLTSEAYQIWKNATDANPALKKTIENLPNVVYSSRAHTATRSQPEGVLLYMRTAEGNDSLAWIDREGESVTQSQLAILRAAQCEPDTPVIPRDEQHHLLVEKGAEMIAKEEKSTAGQLGRTSSARSRTYERLKRHLQEVKGTLFETRDLNQAFESVLKYPLRSPAIEILNRNLKGSIDDYKLAELVVELHKDGRLCLVHEEAEKQEPQIICSLGLFEPKGK